MVWCPKCRSEYVEGKEECPVCHVALVDEEPREDVEYVPETWKLAAEYSDEEMGNLAEGLLEQNGIECRLENMTFHAAPVNISQDMTRIKVWVQEADLATAQELLNQAEDYNFCSECGAVVTKTDQECPECGASLED